MWGARAPRCQPPAPQPSRVPQTLDHSQKCYSRVYEIIKSDLGICGARAPRCQSSSTRWQPPTLQFSRVLESPSDTRANSKMLFSRTRNHNSQMRSPKIRRPTGSAASVFRQIKILLDILGVWGAKNLRPSPQPSPQNPPHKAPTPPKMPISLQASF